MTWYRRDYVLKKGYLTIDYPRWTNQDGWYTNTSWGAPGSVDAMIGAWARAGYNVSVLGSEAEGRVLVIGYTPVDGFYFTLMERR